MCVLCVCVQIPMASMFAGQVAHQAEEALEHLRRSIPFQTKVEGLDALKDGDLSAKISTTKLVDELFSFLAAQVYIHACTLSLSLWS